MFRLNGKSLVIYKSVIYKSVIYSLVIYKRAKA